MTNEIKKIQSLYDEFKEAEQVYEQQIHNNPKYQNAYNKLNVDHDEEAWIIQKIGYCAAMHTVCGGLKDAFSDSLK